MRVPKIFGPADRDRFPSDFNGRDDFAGRRRRESEDARRSDSRNLCRDDAIPTRTLFVGNLDLGVNVEQIRREFCVFGRVNEVDIKRPPRGAYATYAFVKFADVECARRAKTELEGLTMGKMRIRLGYGKGSPTTRVHVGGLGAWTSLEWLEREFDRYGAIHHIDFTAGSDRAVIQFDSVDAALAAAREMNRDSADRERKISVSFADPLSPGSEEPGGSWLNNAERSPAIVEPTDLQTSVWTGETEIVEEVHDSPTTETAAAGGSGKRPWTDSEELLSPSDDNGPDAKRTISGGSAGKESLQDVARRFAIAWRGSLALRNMAFPLRMHLVGGDPMVAQSFLRQGGSPLTGGSAIVPITQRLRLDPDKLDEVRRRVANCGPTGHCVLLALPAPLPQQSIEETSDTCGFQFRALRNLVTYLRQKQAAGVATLERTSPSGSSVPSANTDASETCAALHAFPPSDFAREQLVQIAPRLSEEAYNDDHLVVLLVCQ